MALELIQTHYLAYSWQVICLELQWKMRKIIFALRILSWTDVDPTGDHSTQLRLFWDLLKMFETGLELENFLKRLEWRQWSGKKTQIWLGGKKGRLDWNFVMNFVTIGQNESQIASNSHLLWVSEIKPWSDKKRPNQDCNKNKNDDRPPPKQARHAKALIRRENVLYYSYWCQEGEEIQSHRKYSKGHTSFQCRTHVMAYRYYSSLANMVPTPVYQVTKNLTIFSNSNYMVSFQEQIVTK